MEFKISVWLAPKTHAVSDKTEIIRWGYRDLMFPPMDHGRVYSSESITPTLYIKTLMMFFTLQHHQFIVIVCLKNKTEI